MTYVPLVDHADYEIYTQYPHTIRHIRTHDVIDTDADSDLHITVKLGRKIHKLQSLVAKQFVPNDDPVHNTCIIHINKIPYDDHISNIKWVPPADVLREHRYIDPDDIPSDLFPVGFYRRGDATHNYRGYYYSLMKNAFYKDTGYNYMLLHFHQQGPRAYVNATDTLGRVGKIYYSDFRRMNGLEL